MDTFKNEYCKQYNLCAGPEPVRHNSNYRFYARTAFRRAIVKSAADNSIADYKIMLKRILDNA